MIDGISELFGIEILASKQGPKWKGKVVLYVGDNMDVVTWLRTYESTNRIVRHLLWCLSFWSGECGFIFLPFAFVPATTGCRTG